MTVDRLILQDWIDWFQEVLRPDTLRQLALLAVAGLLAYGLAAVLRRRFVPVADRASTRSVLFGQRIYDGVLFPALWLLAAWGVVQALGIAVHTSLFRLALPVLLALLLIRLGVKLLRAAFDQAQWVRSLENNVSWAVWLGMVLWVSGALPVFLDQLALFRIKIGASTVSLRTVLEGSLAVGFTLLVSFWISSLIEQRLLRGATGGLLSLRKIMANVVRVVLVFLGLVLALSAVGIDLTALSVFGGALGVGIGLGLQRLAANYVSGFVLLAERSVRIGDTVKVDGFEGRIADITARYTVIRSLSGVDAILPNETMVTQRVDNTSLFNNQVWLSTTVAVGYDSDVALVQRLLEGAALAQPRVLRKPPPAAMLESFGADGLGFRLGFWIADPEAGSGGLLSDINKQILADLRANTIDIPYPQRVLRWADGAAPVVVADSARPVAAPPAVSRSEPRQVGPGTLGAATPQRGGNDNDGATENARPATDSGVVPAMEPGARPPHENGQSA